MASTVDAKACSRQSNEDHGLPFKNPFYLTVKAIRDISEAHTGRAKSLCFPRLPLYSPIAHLFSHSTSSLLFAESPSLLQKKKTWKTSKKQALDSKGGRSCLNEYKPGEGKSNSDHSFKV